MQRFHAVPHDIATCMYYTGIDLFTKQDTSRGTCATANCKRREDAPAAR